MAHKAEDNKEQRDYGILVGILKNEKVVFSSSLLVRKRLPEKFLKVSKIFSFNLRFCYLTLKGRKSSGESAQDT